MTELEKAQRELEEYERDVREGKERLDPAYRRALLMRIDYLKEQDVRPQPVRT
jgi:hypothetical protein